MVSNIFYFPPLTLGSWSNLRSIFCKWVGSTTNSKTRRCKSPQITVPKSDCPEGLWPSPPSSSLSRTQPPAPAVQRSVLRAACHRGGWNRKKLFVGGAVTPSKNFFPKILLYLNFLDRTNPNCFFLHLIYMNMFIYALRWGWPHIYIYILYIYMVPCPVLPVPPPPMVWVQNLRFGYIFMEPAKTRGIYNVLTSSASETVVFAAFCNTTLYTTTLIVLLLLLLPPLLGENTRNHDPSTGGGGGNILDSRYYVVLHLVLLLLLVLLLITTFTTTTTTTTTRTTRGETLETMTHPQGGWGGTGRRCTIYTHTHFDILFICQLFWFKLFPLANFVVSIKPEVCAHGFLLRFLCEHSAIFGVAALATLLCWFERSVSWTCQVEFHGRILWGCWQKIFPSRCVFFQP